MLNNFATRRRFAKSYGLLLACTAALATSSLAQASTFSLAPDCSASGGELRCSLLEVLRFLHAIAGILAFALIVVAGLALKSYRKIKQDGKKGL